MAINNTYKQLSLFLALILSLIGTPHAVAERHPLLISSDELQIKTKETSLVIIDTRPQSDYAKGHIPSAVNIPVNKTFNDAERKDLVAPLSKIQEIFQSNGINNDSTIVVYDDGPNFHAARVFWVLELYGHRDVLLLDGGIKTWLEEGRELSTQTPSPKRGNFIPAVNPDRLATKYGTRLSTLNQNVVIIDTRTPEFYNGEIKKPESIRAGHIPTAINKRWNTNLANNQETGKFKQLEELADLYRDISPDQKIIARWIKVSFF